MRHAAVLVLALSACTHTQWGQRSILVETLLVTACDIGQTNWMSDGGKWDKGLAEADPLFSPHPTFRELTFAQVGAVGAEVALPYLIPDGKWRWAELITVSVLETANVVSNFITDGRQAGVCGIGGR